MTVKIKHHRRPKLTPAQAKSFDRTSVSNALAVVMQLKCPCQPYEDVFTYNRWQVLGYQVQRGEKAIKLPLVKSIEVENEEGETENKRILGSSAVFCRCQVKEKE